MLPPSAIAPAFIAIIEIERLVSLVDLALHSAKPLTLIEESPKEIRLPDVNLNVGKFLKI